MPKIPYVSKRFSLRSRSVIAKAVEIIEEYRLQGYTLTLRQLYYQFVARDLLPNTLQSYKRLGSIINDARLAGLIDWNSIVDLTRNLRSLPSWDSPEDIIEACAQSFRLDKWKTQPYYVEVWIEKDALIGVISNVCEELQVPYFSCRGYVSQSECWRAAMRYRGMFNVRDQKILLIHLGDHDPSGIDMTRDIADRMYTFRVDLEVKRIALTMDQVQQFNPPPNPVKLTDSRAHGYIMDFGIDDSWELDALEPAVIGELIQETVLSVRDEEKWDAEEAEEEEHKSELQDVSDSWSEVVDFLAERD